MCKQADTAHKGEGENPPYAEKLRTRNVPEPACSATAVSLPPDDDFLKGVRHERATGDEAVHRQFITAGTSDDGVLLAQVDAGAAVGVNATGRPYTALSIAGSDCSGGAGIQADLKTFAAHGVFGMSVITSVVAENTVGVLSAQDVSPKIVSDQIDCVFQDILVDAVKVGMLPNVEVMKAVAAGIERYGPAHVVVDPVMYATSGDVLMDPAAMQFFIDRILPLATVLTPNIPEAQRLSGMRICTTDDQLAATKIICKKVGREVSVLVKGGHTLEGLPIGGRTDAIFSDDISDAASEYLPRAEGAGGTGPEARVSLLPRRGVEDPRGKDSPTAFSDTTVQDDAAIGSIEVAREDAGYFFSTSPVDEDYRRELVGANLPDGSSTDTSCDILCHRGRAVAYVVRRIKSSSTHGTGCTLSSAIAANLAKGFTLDDAILRAKWYVTGAIAHGLPLGRGHGPTDHFHYLYRQGSSVWRICPGDIPRVVRIELEEA